MRAAAEKDFRVVCLGGSAGSLEAYKVILRHVPADTGMAFVIASHRNFENASLLLQILARVTTMPVVEVEEGMSLEPNRVYLMPPSVEMTVKNNEFALQPPRKPRGWPITISIFLLSRGPSRIGTKFYAKLYLVVIQLVTDAFVDETPDCRRFSC